jgi:hypothetical protein
MMQENGGLFANGSMRLSAITTDDSLNPIQDVAVRKVARASRFTAYKSHTFHTLGSGPHQVHIFQGVSCSFLHGQTRESVK